MQTDSVTTVGVQDGEKQGLQVREPNEKDGRPSGPLFNVKGGARQLVNRRKIKHPRNPARGTD